MLTLAADDYLEHLYPKNGLLTTIIIDQDYRTDLH